MLVGRIPNIIAAPLRLIDVHSGVVHQLSNDLVNEIVQLFRKGYAFIEHCLYGCRVPLEKVVRQTAAFQHLGLVDMCLVSIIQSIL